MTEETGPTIDINTGIVKGEVISFQLLGKEIEKLNTDNEEMIVRDINCYRHPLYERFLPQETGKQTGNEERRNIVPFHNRGRMDKIRNTAFRTLGLVLTGSSLPVIAASCTTTPVVAVAPAPDIDLIQTETATPTEVIDYEATATAQAVEQEEARQAENAERLSKMKTTWDFEWIDNNTKLNDSIENIVEEYWERARNDKHHESLGIKVSFLFAFIADDDTGAFWAGGPYALGPYKSLSDYSGRFFSKSKIVDQELLDRMITATTDHYVDWENNKGLWDPNKEYTHLYYITQEEDEYGEFNGIYPSEGGFFRLFSDRKPEYISLEDAPAKLTEEEMMWAEEHHNTFDYRYGEDGVGRGDTSIFEDQTATPVP